MTVPSRPETTARHALWLGGLLVVLAGLLGMHGLDSHGAAGMDTTHAVVTRSATDAVAAGHHSMAAAVHEAGSAVTAVTVATGHTAMDGDIDGGCCVAIIAVALIVLLQLLRTARMRPLYRLLAHPARVPGHQARDPDPPSLISLSIQRC